MNLAPRYWLRRFGESDLYRLIAPLLLVGCLLIASAASLGTYLVYRTQAGESAKRVEAIAGLQDCFDSYATASAATSKAVREASADLSLRQLERDQALQGLYVYIADVQTTGQPDPDRATLVFTELLTANTALVRSHRRLAAVRDRFPVPDPPSSFCTVAP